MSAPLNILIVINPKSGDGDRSKITDAIAQYFRGTTHICDHYRMTGDHDAMAVREKIDSGKPDRVIAVGGDGTLKFLAEQLLHTDIPLGLLPAGSANGMARELGIPDDPRAALKIAVEGPVRRMDVIRINDEFISLHLSDIGMNAQLVKYFERGNRRGMWGYARMAWRVLRQKEPIRLSVVVDGQPKKCTALMAVLANARLYGTGIAINPKGNVFDGRFELVLMKRLSTFEIFKMIARNQRFNKKKTEIIVAEHVLIETEAPAYFQVDGEYIGTVSRVDARIEKGALAIIVPPES